MSFRQDHVAAHQDGDEFQHHVHAPLVEAAAELSSVDEAFASAKPRRDSLDKALACKVCFGWFGGEGWPLCVVLMKARCWRGPGAARWTRLWSAWRVLFCGEGGPL